MREPNFESQKPCYRKKIYFSQEDVRLLDDLKKWTKRDKKFQIITKKKGQEGNEITKSEQASFSKSMVILIRTYVNAMESKYGEKDVDSDNSNNQEKD